MSLLLALTGGGAPGNNQELAVTLDDVSVNITQSRTHEQSLAAVLDDVSVAIVQQGPAGDVQVNGAGFVRLDRNHYKYKYKIEEPALKAIEQAAEQRISSAQVTTLQTALERLGVVYHDAYNKAFTEIVAQLRAEKAAQDAEDEQIAQIIAALI